MESHVVLPRGSDLSPSVIKLLNEELSTKQQLTEASCLVSDLSDQCSHLNQKMKDLCLELESTVCTHLSFSDRIHSIISEANSKMNSLASTSAISPHLSYGEEKGKWMNDLSIMSKEASKIEAVNTYVDTALKLDNFVVVLEEAVSCAQKKTRKLATVPYLKDPLFLAIETLGKIEELLMDVANAHPRWERLVSAADYRVDRALAILRPLAIADYRSVLSSLGWPPPFSASAEKSASIHDSLLSMGGAWKRHYCSKFFELCSLQHLQNQRKSRQFNINKEMPPMRQPLWAIEELVNPVSVACERHFSKWINKPEFIFALMYKITRDHVDAMDNVLQPLVDEANMSGCSCREEWISGMVISLTLYLEKEIFPALLVSCDEENDDLPSDKAESFLNLVDLMIAFDKRIQSMNLFSVVDFGDIQMFSCLSVFCNQPHWLDIWAEIELKELLEKLNSELVDESGWKMKIQGATVLLNHETYNSPLVSTTVIRYLSSIIDRCRSLPTTRLQSRFLSQVAVPIICEFQDCLLLRCQEAEGLTALTDDNAIIKVCNSINAARYIESVLQEWGKDVFFLEIELCNKEHSDAVKHFGFEDPGNQLTVGIFEDEISKLQDFRLSWVEKMSTVIFRGFDADIQRYIRNKRQWREDAKEGSSTPSKGILGALDYLQRSLLLLEENLNATDFVVVWRRLAALIDSMIFGSILISNVKFTADGIRRLGSDMGLLFGVFKDWCLVPEAFFPKLNESLKLLSQGEAFAAHGDIHMRDMGIRHLTTYEAEKVLKCRVLFNH